MCWTKLITISLINNSIRPFLILVILILISGCSNISGVSSLENNVVLPIDDNNNSQPEIPLQEKLNFEQASNYSALQKGIAVMAQQNGVVVFEDYHDGGSENTATHLNSGTKGFWGLVIARMIQEGLLTGYNQKVSEILVEWRGTAKQSITIRQLMQLSSGLANDIDNLQGHDPDAPDLYFHAVNNVNLVSLPGSRFSYGPVHFYVMGEVMSRVLEKAGGEYRDPLDYLNRKFLSKIGIEYHDWLRDDVGQPHIPNGAMLTPRQWIKWGQFLLQKGQWNGEQLVDPTLFSELFQPSPNNPGHGLFLWLNTPGGFSLLPSMAPPAGSLGGMIYNNGLTDMFACMGAGKNRLYIIPSKNLVILRQTLEEEDEFSDHEFLKLIFE